MKSVLLINPNGSRPVTDTMVAIARRHLPHVTGWTNEQAPPMLTEPGMLATAADQVAGATLPAASGVIVAAFGDPGAARLADRLDCPVVGIGAAAARAAARDGACFTVVTTTPALRDAIDALMHVHGAEGSYRDCFLTQGDPQALLADPVALDAALLAACVRAEAAGVDRIIIGGGPLAEAAIRLAPQVATPLIQPLAEACKDIAGRVG